MLRKYTTAVKKYPNQTYDRIVPPPDEGDRAVKRHDKLDEDGICMPGEELAPGDVFINKQTPTNTSDTLVNTEVMPDSAFKASPQIYKGPVPCIVDKVL